MTDFTPTQRNTLGRIIREELRNYFPIKGEAMNFEQTIREIAAANATSLTAGANAALAKLSAGHHPRLWHALENLAANKYERETGNKIGAGFDWSTIKDWLIKNLPVILSIIMMLLPLL